jgi:cytochrome P450
MNDPWRLKLWNIADWTPVYIYPTVLRLVARLSARVFVGFPLCRDEDWLKVSILFTIDIFKTADQLRSVPWFIRPFKAFFGSSVKTIDSHRNTAKNCLTPIIEARLAEEEAMKKAGKPAKNHSDLLQWYRDIVRPEHRTPDALAELQLTTSMVSIHTTSLTLTNILLDLASHPEYIQPLREEMEATIREDGGVMQKTTLRKMRKVDSFIRESFRGKLLLCK